MVSTQLKKIVEMRIFPNGRGENKTYLKPPPSLVSYVEQQTTYVSQSLPSLDEFKTPSFPW